MLKSYPRKFKLELTFRVFNYVVADALPLSTFESTQFRELIREVDPRVQIVCIKTLKERIAIEFIKFKENLRCQFQSSIGICLTADAWG